MTSQSVQAQGLADWGLVVVDGADPFRSRCRKVTDRYEPLRPSAPVRALRVASQELPRGLKPLRKIRLAMGCLDVLTGRRKLAGPAHDRLFAISTKRWLPLSGMRI